MIWRAVTAALLFIALARPCPAKFDYYTSSRSVVTVFCESSKSFGGGVIISRSSIISMLHVTAPCRQVSIGYYDGTSTIGTVTSTDDDRDLSLIRPEQVPDMATPSQLNLDSPAMDDRLHTISHLNGMTWTYSPAIMAYPDPRLVGVEDRKFSLYIVNTSSFVGSSGGALFDNDGRVLGFAKGMLAGTPIAYFVPSQSACKHIIECKVKR